MDSYSDPEIELDRLRSEYAAASLDVKAAQAHVRMLGGLKKKKKKGYSAGKHVEKWNVATQELEEAKFTAAELKARLDELEAQAAGVKAAVGQAASLSEHCSDQENGGARTAGSKKGGSDEEAVATMDERPRGSEKESDQEIEGPHIDLAENVGQAASLSGQSSDQESGGVRNAGSKKGGSNEEVAATMDERPHASEKESDQRNNVNQEPHIDLAEEKDNQETRETRAQEIEGPFIDVVDKSINEGSQETRAPVSEKNGHAQEVEGPPHVAGSKLSAPTEPNTKKRKYDDGDEETAGAEGHVGPGPRKIFKNKANGEEIDEDKILSEVNEVLQRPLSSRLSIATRSAIRTHQTLAPTAATTSRSLALDILTTNRGNILCPYHQEVDKRGTTDSKYLVNGVPWPRMIADTKKAAESAEHKQRLKEGGLHCGCPMDAALSPEEQEERMALIQAQRALDRVNQYREKRAERNCPMDADFFFWKSLTLTATINDKEAEQCTKTPYLIVRWYGVHNTICKIQPVSKGWGMVWDTPYLKTKKIWCWGMVWDTPYLKTEKYGVGDTIVSKGW
ncbi:hypothetical protein F5887DRAFT_925395 [Amanita rubescens]|nr:hypothetical protein F5887DRAFT_925395 [Amanita rubescens]